MEFLIIVIILIITMIILAIVCKINIKEIKKIGENKKLDEVANKLPENIEICKYILRKLKNTNVNIEENKEANTSLYIAISNKILIANVKNSFTRIQTIAHECLHSIQDRRMLTFNFIYSNIYLIYFIITTILAVVKILPYKMVFLNILIVMSYIYYFIRSYLETDAMIKARYLAKEYMEETQILDKKEIEEIVEEYDKLNSVGIKAINYNLILGTIVKVIIFTIICFLIK